MKKPILFFLYFVFLSLSGFPQNSNGTGGGAWNDPASWAANAVPVPTTHVTIVSGDMITLSSTQNCKTITVNAGGTLKLISGASLGTSATVTIKGELRIESGTFNVGNTKTKYLYVSGGTLYFSGGTINVSGRYSQKSGGNAYLSGNATLNVGTLPGQDNSSIHIFSVTTNGTFSVATGSSVQIVLKSGNSGAASEVYYSPTTSDFNGGKLLIENSSGVSDIFMDSDMPVFNLESDVGAGNTFHLAAGCHMSLNNFSLLSGSAIADAGARISINGTASLGSDGNFTLKVDTTNASSIYFAVAPAEKINVSTFLKGSKFYYISPPVSVLNTFSTLAMNLTGGSGNDSFFRWDEDAEYNGVKGSWVDILNGPDGTGTHSLMSTENFQTALGYSIRYQHADHTLSLTGNVLDTDQSISVTKTAGSSAKGWNLVGNPFTASIAANSKAGSDNFLSANATLLDPVYSGLYLWNEQASYSGGRDDYFTVSNASPAKYISVGQAFMVKAAAAGSLAFNKNFQNNVGSAVFYKNDPVDNWSRCWFSLTANNGLENKILIAFGRGMTRGLDVSYDAGKLKGNSEIALYSKLVEDIGGDFAIQALPTLNIPETVLLGFDVGSVGDYTLSLSRLENIDDTVTVYLEDKVLGNLIDLRSQKGYSFHVSQPGSITDRFVLYFNQKITGIPDKKNQGPKGFLVYPNGNNIVIKNQSDNLLVSNIQITDLLGRTLFSGQIRLVAGGSYTTNAVGGRGIIIVTLGNNRFRYSKKIFLK